MDPLRLNCGIQTLTSMVPGQYIALSLPTLAREHVQHLQHTDCADTARFRAARPPYVGRFVEAGISE